MYYIFLLVVFLLTVWAGAFLQVLTSKSAQRLFKLPNIILGVCVVFLLYYFHIGVVG